VRLYARPSNISTRPASSCMQLRMLRRCAVQPARSLSFACTAPAAVAAATAQARHLASNAPLQFSRMGRHAIHDLTTLVRRTVSLLRVNRVSQVDPQQTATMAV